MNKEIFQDAVNKSISKSDICKIFGWPINGRYSKKIELLASEYNVSLLHFNRSSVAKKYQVKYELIQKKCPVCENFFETKKGHKKEKSTCSHSCSNVFFRSGEDNPNWKDTPTSDELLYRKICFINWKKECIICKFDKVVEVHHIDENHNNNDPSNLVPLCPNHHKMFHTKKYKNEIKSLIVKVLNET